MTQVFWNQTVAFPPCCMSWLFSYKSNTKALCMKMGCTMWSGTEQLYGGTCWPLHPLNCIISHFPKHHSMKEQDLEVRKLHTHSRQWHDKFCLSGKKTCFTTCSALQLNVSHVSSLHQSPLHFFLPVVWSWPIADFCHHLHLTFIFWSLIYIKK
jgi:hypothetical protein